MRHTRDDLSTTNVLQLGSSKAVQKHAMLLLLFDSSKSQVLLFMHMHALSR